MLIQRLLDLKLCIECKHNKSLIGSVLSENYGIKNCSESKDYTLDLDILNYLINFNWDTLPATNYIIDDHRKFNYIVLGVTNSIIFNYKKEFILLPDCSYKVVSDIPEYNSTSGLVETKQEITLLFKHCNEVRFCNACFEEYLNNLELICKG